LIVKISTALI